MAALRLTIRGRVQGVGYRAWAAGRGRALGLRGWVRNLPDGAVEAVAAGDPEALRAFAEACRAGPPAARVDSVASEEADESLAGDAPFHARF
ncbi:acylphosphatase [Oceanicella actignis]|uniref:acylphosphatase n=1 Tax=Oceanicella actignis TaxID=1189325 RepID=A0A1M7TKV1_9RHOB|nr:acylphosphatase [Oceanicella actignis]TYO88278.1 acylphosphatase [Oceanicella actignis]SET69054.1 acylphosphatase [Oceanicella actignis]SHN71391.1 acylphosphatase [Oceanicella actignis]